MIFKHCSRISSQLCKFMMISAISPTNCHLNNDSLCCYFQQNLNIFEVMKYRFYKGEVPIKTNLRAYNRYVRNRIMFLSNCIKID